MKSKALFVATLIGIGALATQAIAAGPADAGKQRPAASDRVETSETPARRGGKHRHRGHRFAHMGYAGHGAGIARLDTDGDGRISRAELEQAMQARAERGARGQRGPRGHRGAGGGWLLENFDAIDANRDGHVVRSELHAWQQAQRPQREAERERRFNERFDAADLNGDGRLSRIEVDEKMPRLSASFAWMDDNRDGFLSRGELKPQRVR